MTRADKRENVIMIASEPLTFERSDWMEVKTNTMLVITPKVGVASIKRENGIGTKHADKPTSDEPPSDTDYR